MKILFYFMLATASILTGAMASSHGESSARAGTVYRDSSLSDDDYAVTELINGTQISGCAAVNRKTKPPIFFIMLRSGEGTLSLVGPYYSVKKNKKIGRIDVYFDKTKVEKTFTMDGNIMTFDLSKKDIYNADRGGVRINNVQVDRNTYQNLHIVVAKCMTATIR